ncbi:hypothetical protein F975_01754 [Acinetobacter sp. ANC 3789]|uniref:hypothetical protein n=1 Tax=Acinetobacter sp. ANC 3789 TaxID=1217714 RepID=UPI0002CEE122|nr:hypothetical protein [Acinetobacter sp. ANC 3789]ENU80002.1 hypothetical protein F975_01754 [Acinetobacter sp. ANC 3789]
MIWVWAAIAVLSIFTVLQARKGIKSTLSAGKLEATTADEGSSIPVIFGTCDVAPNCVAFQAGTPQAIKKKA